ncbi:GRIP and coiled-coil domain-containing protein 1 [Anolis sagrei]|uniref:GRIP and coiled-coil domain-containing protein 1 n=1 Tax=Anolis sagrei TaxID=38937 RepID=UPI00352097F4
MEKFGVSFGGGPSRKDLLETVEQQREQLAQYQARLKDVVRAYKGLLKEKEALEASLRVLSVAHQPLDDQEPAGPGAVSEFGLDASEDRSSGQSEEDGAGPAVEEEEALSASTAVGAEEESGSSGSGEAPGEGGRRVLQLKAQLSTLTASLATVSQEKSRAEASFQADKRRLRQEREEAGRRAEEERARLAEEARAAREQLAETKARLLAQQHDRAQEQADHAAMLRELQRLLQGERALRQEAERGLEESRAALAGRACAAEHAEEAERRARRLQREVEALEGELGALREESARPDPQLQALQAEAAALRSHFQAQLLQEMRKTAHAEERVRAEEDRAAGLEAQISEASELLGSYERAKQRDQLAMQRLRERLSQLDLENKTLALATSGRCPAPDVGLEEESGLDANVLRDRIEKLRALLRAATKRDLGEGEGEGEGEEGEEEGSLRKVAGPPEEEADGEKVSSAAYYQRELRRLKEEFEHYKQQHGGQKGGGGQPAPGGGSEGGSGEGELAEARAQLAALKETYVALRLSHEEQARRQREQAEARRQEASRGQQRQREEVERARREAREEALRLEEELRRQRERALAVLAEKELELERLRALAWPYAAGPPPGPPRPPSPSLPPAPPPAPSAPQEDLTQALRLSGGPGEPPFLLYTEQLARRAVELAGLKREKRRLEGEARRLRERLLAAEEAHREELGALRERLRQSAREQGREGANLEYLKNVFFRFLTLAEGLGRQQTLGAILTVLHFSPEERLAVMGPPGGGAGGSGGAHSGGWWGASGKR